MPRITLSLPEVFPFRTRIPLRITDMNYGNHLANDVVLSLIHEARVQYLASLGIPELDSAGKGIIMGDVAIVYKAQGHYGQSLLVEVAPSDFQRVSFDLYYRLTVEGPGTLVAEAKTGIICFDYTTQKVMSVPAEWRQKMEASA